jgi:hypothetical protein
LNGQSEIELKKTMFDPKLSGRKLSGRKLKMTRDQNLKKANGRNWKPLNRGKLIDHLMIAIVDHCCPSGATNFGVYS